MSDDRLPDLFRDEPDRPARTTAHRAISSALTARNEQIDSLVTIKLIDDARAEHVVIEGLITGATRAHRIGTALTAGRAPGVALVIDLSGLAVVGDSTLAALLRSLEADPQAGLTRLVNCDAVASLRLDFLHVQIPVLPDLTSALLSLGSTATRRPDTP